MVGCPRRHLVLFLARCGTTIRSQSLLLRQFPLSLREDALDWYFNLPSRSISSWDVLANKFYRAFYASGAIHIDMREWEEYENETVEDYDLFEGESDQILELALDQREMGGFRPVHIHPPEVYDSPFPEGYQLPRFVQYRGFGDPREHIRRFLRQCGPTAGNSALCLRQFPLSLEGDRL